jgi:hypothetical protein
MTLIGAFNVQNAVVLFADRQETITDYAKWDEGKIYLFERIGEYRIAMTAAGDPDPINQVWDELWHHKGRHIFGHSIFWPAYENLKNHIIQTVRRVTKKTIFPVPRDLRPNLEMIWAIQPLGQNVSQSRGGIDLFRTLRLSVNEIDMHYFTGNPVLLTKYLSDMYLEGVLITSDEAEALAAYILWEAKEYDPTVGKHSDIFTLRWPHGEISRVTVPELEYWEQHFRFLKGSLRLLPVLSCASTLTKQLYNQKDQLGRLVTTLKTLTKEQEKMRKDKGVQRSKLEIKLIKNLQAAAKKFEKSTAPIPSSSTSQT